MSLAHNISRSPGSDGTYIKNSDFSQPSQEKSNVNGQNFRLARESQSDNPTKFEDKRQSFEDGNIGSIWNQNQSKGESQAGTKESIGIVTVEPPLTALRNSERTTTLDQAIIRTTGRPIDEFSFRNCSFIKELPFNPAFDKKCPICLAVTEERNMMEYLCGHRTCLSCAIATLQIQIEEEGEPCILCPAHPTCREEIHPAVIRYLLRGQGLDEFFQPRRLPTRKKLFREYEHLSVARALAGDREVRWCPGAGCRYAVLVGAWRECCPSVICDVCELEFCGVCGTELHPGRPCPALEDIVDMFPDLVRRCPVCKAPHARLDGCNYGQCNNRYCGEFKIMEPPSRCKEKCWWKCCPSKEPGCKTRFCWCCNEEVSTIRHYSLRRRARNCRFGYLDVYQGFWPIAMYLNTPCPIVVFVGTFLFLFSFLIVPPFLCIYIPYYWHKRFKKRRDQIQGRYDQSSASPPTTPPSSQVMPTPPNSSSPIFNFLDSISKKKAAAKRSLKCRNREYDEYKKAKFSMEYGCDPISFWFCRVPAFPTLSRFALEILSIPATSASIERTFSVAGQLIGNRRGMLSSKALEESLKVKCNRRLLQ